MSTKNDTCIVHLRETTENRKNIAALTNVVESIRDKVFIGNGMPSILSRLKVLEMREKIYVAIGGLLFSTNIALLGWILKTLLEISKQVH
jgi:hypothetical protein